MKSFFKTMLLCLFGLYGQLGIAQDKDLFSDIDSAIYWQYMQQADPELSIGEGVLDAARFFIDRPYVAGTLETDHEQLRVNLHEFDCTTLMETCLALSKTRKSKSVSMLTYVETLTGIRYRNGLCSTYTSRLHYFSDWVGDNEKRANVRNITKDIGGKQLSIPFNFMSTHANKYPMLADQPLDIAIIKKQEAALSTQTHYYIPKEQLLQHQSKIKDGDIVAIVTSLAGIDVTHVGIACWTHSELSFVHASQTAGKVILNKESLENYLLKAKSRRGLIVARPL